MLSDYQQKIRLLEQAKDHNLELEKIIQILDKPFYACVSAIGNPITPKHAPYPHLALAFKVGEKDERFILPNIAEPCLRRASYI